MEKPEQPEQPKEQLGLLVSGIIMSKNHYPGRDGKQDRYGVDVAIPGCREMISISMPLNRWGPCLQMQNFKSLCTFRTYKGAVYFEVA